MTDVHFFSKRPLYFFSTSPDCKEQRTKFNYSLKQTLKKKCFFKNLTIISLLKTHFFSTSPDLNWLTFHNIPKMVESKSGGNASLSMKTINVTSRYFLVYYSFNSSKRRLTDFPISQGLRVSYIIHIIIFKYSAATSRS